MGPRSLPCVIFHVLSRKHLGVGLTSSLGHQHRVTLGQSLKLSGLELLRT